MRRRPCYENISQTGHIPLKCANFNVQTSSELQPHSDVPHQRATRNSKAVTELCMHWDAEAGGERHLSDMLFSFLTQFGGMHRWLARRGWGCTFSAPEGVLHCEKLGPLNGWRSLSGWCVRASHTTAVTCLCVCECVRVRMGWICVPLDRRKQ